MQTQRCRLGLYTTKRQIVHRQRAIKTCTVMHFDLSRRSVVASGASLLTATLQFELSAADKANSQAKWRRYNVNSPEGQQMLKDYKVAVAKLLELSPYDLRNWYRIAFTHLLDCPHGNWWFAPWHRGYLGWVEQIVRQFSDNPNFAFPYWDWTANPAVPEAMTHGVLDPQDKAFINNVDEFEKIFKPVIAASGYFDPNSLQFQQLKNRKLISEDDLWKEFTDYMNPLFFPIQEYRNVRNQTVLLDCLTANKVSSKQVATVMAATAYVAAPDQSNTDQHFFSSSKAHNHSGMGVSTLLEQIHNQVHNNTGGIVHPFSNDMCSAGFTNTGGFMQAFLSAVDPLFFIHHANIDRLWTAWTQKQIAAKMPYQPTGTDLDLWLQEPFLFYCDTSGKPVPQAKAGDYTTTAKPFNYDYQPGSVGTKDVLSRKLFAFREKKMQPIRLVGQPAREYISETTNQTIVANCVTVNPDLMALLAPERVDTAVIYVTLELPQGRGKTFPVIVGERNSSSRVEVEIGRIALFGNMMSHEPMTFALSFGEALTELDQRGALKSDKKLFFTVLAPANSTNSSMDIPVQSVVIVGN